MRRKVHVRFLIGSVLGAFLQAVFPATAVGVFQDIHWVGAGTGGDTASDRADSSTLWNSPNNWQEGVVPSTGNDHAYLNFTNAGVVYPKVGSSGCRRIYIDGTSKEAYLHFDEQVDEFDMSNLSVGSDGVGEVRQTAGSVEVNWGMVVGGNASGVGTYRLSGGELRTSEYGLTIGCIGEGYFIHTGGTYTAHIYDLTIGEGGTGLYDLSGDGHLEAQRVYVGEHGYGSFTQTGGTASINGMCFIGYGSASTGAMTVDGTGSTWTGSNRLSVGHLGDGTLNITGGAAVSNDDLGFIGCESGSTGAVTVDGAGSAWTNSDDLYVGRYGDGTLNITGGGLVSVAETLTIDADEDGDSFINMSTGGMLALFGDADDSLTQFLGLIEGTDAIRYWDDNISDWDDITHATGGLDYELSYLTEGDLSGYTMLTVPEPATLGLLAAGLGAALTCRRARRKP